MIEFDYDIGKYVCSKCERQSSSIFECDCANDEVDKVDEKIKYGKAEN